MPSCFPSKLTCDRGRGGRAPPQATESGGSRRSPDCFLNIRKVADANVEFWRDRCSDVPSGQGVSRSRSAPFNALLQAMSALLPETRSPRVENMKGLS